MGYRKKYSRITGIDVDKYIHIHHINLDRSCNEFYNLIHVDIHTHNKYHTSLRGLERSISKPSGCFYHDLVKVDEAISHINNLRESIITLQKMQSEKEGCVVKYFNPETGLMDIKE